MQFHLYSHCAGDKAVPAELREEVATAIRGIRIKMQVGAAAKLRTALLSQLVGMGWSHELPVSRESDMTITSSKQSVGLCLQTGNVARSYADLMKLQVLYLNDAIHSAVVIVPSEQTARLLGKNIAQSKRLERELDIFKKAYHVPTLLFALEL